jgi:hypothetical protein
MFLQIFLRYAVFESTEEGKNRITVQQNLEDKDKEFSRF